MHVTLSEIMQVSMIQDKKTRLPSVTKYLFCAQLEINKPDLTFTITITIWMSYKQQLN